ncbi:hypothetical protein BH753_gp102 [Bacillus phage Shbh1]|uniref:Uncharacterized protein n=1 Tax=Bacillus phage Shbh1 TaxID=1796992 RepID=A0A142F1C7_9CAUD|nr:hypothetical protein BH753_gp102 [Bacillus phage Shbh1]AMQ66584.1 hypothetical protein [Bacillus phage Shbh1]
MDNNKYHSTIRVEFRDLIKNLVESSRKNFHIYTIHRLLSLGLLIDFTFRYVKVEECDCVGIEMDLKNTGKVLFVTDIDSNYVKISNKDKRVLQSFLEELSTISEANKTHNVF